MKILITGGAGFVGASLACQLKREHPSYKITCLDNLRRRGSETNLEILTKQGIQFIHGDIRQPGDFPLPDFDVLLECSAEPSVLAGYGTSPTYALDTNLGGTINCLNECRKAMAHLVFISTSRVYPVKSLVSASIFDAGTGFRFAKDQLCRGISGAGVSEELAITGSGPRSIYGTTKAASEMLCEEYAAAYGVPVTINRCGVLTGPGQMARADQGIFAFWMLCHLLNRPLKYIGFGGSGKQSRDLLHIDDLGNLINMQIHNRDRWNGKTFNVGGGEANTLSLLDTTEICREISGSLTSVHSSTEERPMDIPCYYSDCRALFAFEPNWKPRKSARETMQDVFEWMSPIREKLERILFD